MIGNPKVMIKFADFCPGAVCLHAGKDLKDNVKLLIFLNFNYGRKQDRSAGNCG